jgi:hypothetical protein
MLMHESDTPCQLWQHRWYKHLLNVISTLKQTGCTVLYIDSTKLMPQTGYELQIKRLGLVISVAKS